MSNAPLPLTPAQPIAPHGLPRFGSFQGEASRVNLDALAGTWKRSGLQRALRRKRWNYSLVATPEVLVAFVITDLGYVANAFVTAVNLKSGVVLCDESFMGLPGVHGRVGDAPGAGLDASFRARGAGFSVLRGVQEDAFQLAVSLPARRSGLTLRASLQSRGAAPALSVLAPVDDARVNFTQKVNALPARGSLTVGGKTYSLDGGVGGMDYTQGDLARHTAWRWAFAAGHLADGRAVGFNLVEGFNEGHLDANENALWVGEALFPLGRARFTYEEHDLGGAWGVRTEDGALDVSFRSLAVHREDLNIGLIVSHYVQPLGLFHGEVRVNGETLQLESIPGVTERQDMRW